MTASSPPTVSSSVYADGCVFFLSYLFIFPIFSYRSMPLSRLCLGDCSCTGSILQ